jgi:hypothetical protein
MDAQAALDYLKTRRRAHKAAPASVLVPTTRTLSRTLLLT